MIVHANRSLPGSGLKVYEVENLPLRGVEPSQAYGSTWWFNFGPGYAYAFYAEGDEITLHVVYEDDSKEYLVGTRNPETGDWHISDMDLTGIVAFIYHHVAKQRREALAA